MPLSPILFRRLFLIAALCFGSPTLAQETDDISSRAPEDGLAVLDCAPPRPAPGDSCIVRVPSGYVLTELESEKVGDQEVQFKILRKDADLPEDVLISSTLVMIDLSRGPSNGRLQTWPRERDAIIRMIENLPSEGELAIYGFGADLTLLSSFSTSRDLAIAAVRAIEIDQNNTILSTNLRTAIEQLRDRSDAVLKNLIVISDGDEEGIGSFEGLAEQAAQAGVTLSAFGTFWRPDGAQVTSRGKDKLKQIVEPANGLRGDINLLAAGTVDQQVDAFVERFNDSIGLSGVIVPNGDPVPARIIVEMRAPAGSVAPDRSFSALFTPVVVDQAGDEDVSSDEETAAEGELLFGFPKLYVYAAIAALALFLLLLIVVLLRRRSQDGGFENELEISTAPSPQNEPTHMEVEKPVAPLAPAPLPISAYLVRADTGERLPVQGELVTIGRAPDNNVVVTGEGVSRSHARLVRTQEGSFAIADMGSLNKTFINGVEVKGTKPVRIGDTIGLGKLVQVRLTLP